MPISYGKMCGVFLAPISGRNADDARVSSGPIELTLALTRLGRYLKMFKVSPVLADRYNCLIHCSVHLRCNQDAGAIIT